MIMQNSAQIDAPFPHAPLLPDAFPPKLARIAKTLRGLISHSKPHTAPFVSHEALANVAKFLISLLNCALAKKLLYNFDTV